MNTSVLIVEDDPDMRLCLVEHFKRAGFETISAENGAAALDILKTTVRIDCIILDLDMPILSGYHFLNYNTPSATRGITPVIIFSGEIDAHHLIGAAGVVAVFTKSASIGELIDQAKKLSTKESRACQYV